MCAVFFTIRKIPDLTLAQYSAEESGGVSDVIRQHAAFYRQLNRKGVLFDETYHLAYVFNPKQPLGRRLNVFLIAEGNNGQPVRMEEFLTASPLSSYFRFEQETPLYDPVFPYCATMCKQDGFVSSMYSDTSNGYYVVNPWKANEKARLMGLFKMMQKLQQPVAYVVTMKAVDLSETMRESFRTQIQYIRNLQKTNMSNRDENADQCLRIYDKFLESLRNNPHFMCRVCSYAQEESLAKMILDAAAAESVEEGNYRILCEKGQFQPLSSTIDMKELCLNETPRGMKLWNGLFLLKEMVPFVMLPVLYPGETIELPKESAPIYEKTGLYLGKDNNGYSVYCPLDLLNKHALLAGVPGSGKTYSMLHIASQIGSSPNDIPFLVLEPAKKEYRALARNERIPDVLVFSPGAAGSFPLRINPFEFPIGLKLSEHITSLIQVFEGAFDLTPPMPFLVSRGIEQVYRDHDWYPFEVNDGEHLYPTMQELYDKMAQLLEETDYAPEIKSNLKSCLQVRIGSLITREMGNVFNVSSSTFSPEEWLKNKCVIELESLGTDAANFLTLLLLTIIRELLRQNPKADKDKPRHVIFLEEAHNLIGPTTVANAQNGDAKVASTKYIVDMLAEVRALRESIIIADQLPTGLAPQITKNTSLKIAHKITALDDRQLLAATMSADGVQLERMGSFTPGHALCVYESIQKPFEIQITKYDGDPEPPDNDELFELLSRRKQYSVVMSRDFEIIQKKFAAHKERVVAKYEFVSAGGRVCESNMELVKTLKVNNSLRIKIEADLVQLERNICDLAEMCIEYLLEINDYRKTNNLQHNEIIRLLHDETKDVMAGFRELSVIKQEYCSEVLQKVILDRLERAYRR